MYGYDKKFNSSAKLLRENNLDTLPLLSQTEYEELFQCKLPIPTEDLDQLRNDLTEYGYCYLQNAMTDKQVNNLTQRIQEQAIAEVDSGVAHLEGGAQYGSGRKGKSNQRIFALHNKGKIFQEIATCDENVAQHGKIVWTLLEDMLGRGFLLSAANANFAGKGGQAMFLHQDQGCKFSSFLQSTPARPPLSNKPPFIYRCSFAISTVSTSMSNNLAFRRFQRRNRRYNFSSEIS